MYCNLVLSQIELKLIMMINIDTNNYDELAAEFQYQVIKLLNNTLKDYKLSEKARKDICRQFIYDFSILHDKGYILGNKKKYCLTFIFKNQAEILFPNQSFNYHSIATENTFEFFENESENESESLVK